ncbi:MAG: hypothetical protein L6290_10955 [Thermodesulfovibrionales bacterium]|nr:hypothetical protein [Thermodesulfovibrionales bacterium]
MKVWLIFYAFVLLILSSHVFAETSMGGPPEVPSDVSTGATSDDGATQYPSNYNTVSQSNPSYSPPNPAVIKGVKLQNYEGLSVDGNEISFDSVKLAESESFVFNDVINSKLTVKDSLSIEANTESKIDKNILKIENPLDPLQIEKINFYL